MRPPSTASSPRALFETHFGFVWRNLRRLGLSESAADDATQDVFLVVHRRFSSFDPEWSSVETWLFGILLRVAKTHRRSRFRYERWLDRSRSSEEVPSVAPGRSPEADSELREKVLVLERLLADLPDRERDLFVMVDLEQISVPEAANALGVNLNTAYSRLRQARQRVNRRLPPVEFVEPRAADPNASTVRSAGGGAP